MAISKDTTLGGNAREFPDTPWTAIRSARDGTAATRRASLERLIGAYWKPAYIHLRRTWRLSVEDAKDAVQDFFARLLEHEFPRAVDAECRSFRAYLRTALKNYMTDVWRARRAQKRMPAGGFSALDVEAVEPLVADPDAPAPDEAFDREWRRTVLETACGRLAAALEREGRRRHRGIFRLFVGAIAEGDSPATYAAMAKELGISESDVRNGLHQVRGELRREVRRVVRESVDSNEDVEREMNELLSGG
ncbi:MAG: sigma-70 family RNA polymerase sigma factor [Planctomycetota bacterium]